MTKFSKDFFNDKEVLFVGFSSKNKPFCMSIYKAMTNNGIKVYPMNNKSNSNFDIKVYKDFNELPKVPQSAFVLLNKNNAKKVIGQLKDKGIKKILFQSKMTADSEILNQCQQMGMETAIGCPLMLYGSGLHKLHGFFGGVK